MCRETEEIKMKSPTTKVVKKKRKTLHQYDIVDVDTPIRSIACLNKIEDMRRFEESEDCFILGFDPSDVVPPSFDSSDPHHHTDDISVVAEKGKVACRDYPHSRHLCLKFPFKTTPHESCCEMCYCYVCDSAAPCKFWTSGHCNAENAALWESLRHMKKPPQVRLFNSQP